MVSQNSFKSFIALILNPISKFASSWSLSMGSRRGAISKDGLYVHKYTDYELVEDHLKFIVNNLSWSPSHNEYKEYNKLWRKYNESN